MPNSIKEVLGYSTVVGQKEQAIALGKILGGDVTKNSVIVDLKDTNIPSLLRMISREKPEALLACASKYQSEYTTFLSALKDLGYSSNGSL